MASATRTDAPASPRPVRRRLATLARSRAAGRLLIAAVVVAGVPTLLLVAVTVGLRSPPTGQPHGLSTTRVAGARTAALPSDGELAFAGTERRIYDPGRADGEQQYINDHTVIRSPDGTWHLYGITGVESQAASREDTFAHATAPSLNGPWTKQPPVLTVDPDYFGEQHLWAPHVVAANRQYYMFYAAGSGSSAAINLATSTDLWTWTRAPTGPLFRDGYEARDPDVVRIGDEWVMYYTATSGPQGGNHVVAYRTSTDLLHWGSRQIAFTDPEVGTGGGPTESPFVVQRGPFWYLFLGPRGGYVGTDVYRSSDPRSFEQARKAGHLAAHAAEVIQDGNQWWVTAAGWWQGGVSLAELRWTPAPVGVYGDILDRYLLLGGPFGLLGPATSAEHEVSGGRQTDFAGGIVLWSPGTGAHEVHGAILGSYLDAGGPGGWLGLPSSDERGPSWRANDFVGGTLYWSAGTGVAEVHGTILQHYRDLGEASSVLGPPVTGEYGVPGGRASAFTSGVLYWSPDTGAKEVHGALLDRYSALGGPTSWVGWPASDERSVAGGRASSFQGATLYWSSTTGEVHDVHGSIRELYLALRETAYLGLPVTDEVAVPGGRQSTFAHGSIFWSPTTGAVLR